MVCPNLLFNKFSRCIFRKVKSFWCARDPKNRESSLSSLIRVITNLITLKAVCHANHAITKFPSYWRGVSWKEFGFSSVTGFCRCCDPCWHGSVRARVTTYDLFPRWVHWLKPARNIFIDSWFVFAPYCWLDLKKKEKKIRKNKIKEAGRRGNSFLLLLTLFFFLNKLFYRHNIAFPISFFQIVSKLCTFIPDLFNGWIVPKTYTGKLKSFPSLSDTYGCDRGP